MKFIFLFFAVAFVIGLILFAKRPPLFTDDNCIRAVVGEYAVHDYEGMKLLAHAIRNRKSLKGVYGFYAAHILRENKDIWVIASCAWFDSLNEFDPLNGASEWRSYGDLQKGLKPKGMKLMQVHNGLYYYKNLTQ